MFSLVIEQFSRVAYPSVTVIIPFIDVALFIFEIDAMIIFISKLYYTNYETMNSKVKHKYTYTVPIV